jgi:ankyrin repeat protein
LRAAVGGKLREVLDSIGDAVDFFGVELKDVNQRGVYGNTPLKIATVRGDIDAVRVLLDAGAEVDAVVEEGCTVLWYASAFNHPEIVRILLDHGASLETRNILLDQTPLEAAQRRGLREVEEILQEYRVRSRTRH